MKNHAGPTVHPPVFSPRSGSYLPGSSKVFSSRSWLSSKWRNLYGFVRCRLLAGRMFLVDDRGPTCGAFAPGCSCIVSPVAHMIVLVFTSHGCCVTSRLSNTRSGLNGMGASAFTRGNMKGRIGIVRIFTVSGQVPLVFKGACNPGLSRF